VKKWDIDFQAFLNDLKSKKTTILCGDLNVAHNEIDISNPKGNQKSAGFTKEER
jgi:exonuclease III